MPKQVPEKSKKIAEKMYCSGIPTKEVASHIGVDPTSIRNWAKAGGWTISEVTGELPSYDSPVVESLASSPIQLELEINQEMKTFLSRCDRILKAGSTESQLNLINRFAVAIDEALNVVEQDPISYTKELNILSQVLERINRERRYAQGLIQSTIKLEIEKLSDATVERISTLDVEYT